MVEIEKLSRTRFTRPRHSGEISIDMQGPEAISQEVIPVIGGFKDFTGSGGVPTKQLMVMPRPNELFWTDAWLEGADKSELNVIGTRTGTTRLRRKKLLID